MVDIQIEGDKAVFEVEGWDKMWAVKSRVEIPLARIKGAHTDPHPAMGWFDGLKLAGTGLPNIFKAGTFYQQGGLIFWDVSHPEKTIVVELDHEHYSKLIVEVADTDAAVRMIREAIS